MDWWEVHESVLDCKSKIIYFIEDLGCKITLARTNRGLPLRFISMMQLEEKNLRKGCKLYVMVIMNNKKDTMNIAQHPMLSKNFKLFPNKLHGLPPKWELEFWLNSNRELILYWRLCMAWQPWNCESCICNSKNYWIWDLFVWVYHCEEHWWSL